MSRHRNVRSMNYDDEFHDQYDQFVGSVEESDCLSPTDAQQWMYDRARGQSSISEFISNNDDILEDDEATYENTNRRESEQFQLPELNDMDKGKLLSCMEEIRNIIGESVSDKRIVEAIMNNNYDYTKALDMILTSENSTISQPILVKSSRDTRSQAVIEKGIGEMLLEKSEQLKLQKEQKKVTVTVTPAAKRTRITGFEVNSPRNQSPITSGRNSPDDEMKMKNQPKEIRNGRELFEKERGDGKQQIHLVVVGHVDAGKSTLMGHLLFDLGNVSQRVMHKHEQESKKMGKQSFMYAWVLDETGEERARGITMDVGSSRFDTPTKQVTLLDAPGHKDFIPNMISGAYQADVALLVVDATRGEFETGFEQGGQTREHALLVRSLGVNQICVVVNKLDNENWSKDRFDEIVAKLKVFLKQAGFKDSDVSYIPCSGLTGENLVKPASEPELKKWYSGSTLLDMIDTFKTPERPMAKPFRMSISDVFKGTGSGYCLSGRIESGHVCVNDKIMVCPSKEQGQVKNISIDDMPCNTAFAGDQVSVTLNGVDTTNISMGDILSELTNLVPMATKIRVRIVVFSVRTPITLGFPVLVHHQSLIEPATVSKLKAQLHKGTGEVLKKNPRCLGNNSCAQIELTFQRPIAIERYADFKELGRIMLRVGGITIAAGLVTDVL